MRRFNMVYNYGMHEIHLLPNSRFKEAFDYVYTGLALYFERGRIVVEDVIPGSPGELAGIKAGDIVLAVANNFSNNIMLYKTLLQVPNEKIKIVLMRDEKPMIATLKTVTIF